MLGFSELIHFYYVDLFCKMNGFIIFLGPFLCCEYCEYHTYVNKRLTLMVSPNLSSWFHCYNSIPRFLLIGKSLSDKCINSPNQILVLPSRSIYIVHRHHHEFEHILIIINRIVNNLFWKCVSQWRVTSDKRILSFQMQ